MFPFSSGRVGFSAAGEPTRQPPWLRWRLRLRRIWHFLRTNELDGLGDTHF